MQDRQELNPEALERLREWGGETLIVRMIDLFIEHAPVRLAAIRAGLAAGDSDSVERAAHSLKSSAANLGAERVQELSGLVEKAAGSADLTEVERLATPLEEHFGRTMDELRGLRGGEQE